MERQLDDIDRFDASKYGDSRKLLDKDRDDRQTSLDSIDNPLFHDNFPKTRPQILADIKDKLMEYGELP